jgi:hypothetical protein
MTPTATKSSGSRSNETERRTRLFPSCVAKRGCAAPENHGSKSRLAAGETGKDISAGPFARKQAYFNVENHVSTSLRA